MSYPTDHFCMQRQSKDNAVHNSYGLALIDLCCTYGIHVLNGRLFNDIAGEFTCFANNGASIVDYMIASSNLFQYVTNFGVSDNIFSVRCPVYCTFSFAACSTTNNHAYSIDENVHLYERVVWKERYKETFLTSFQVHMNHFMESLVDNDVTASVTAFIDLYKTAADKMLYKPNISNMSRANNQPPWWTIDCARAKRTKFQLLRQFRLSNNMADLHLYKTARNAFKGLC
ncbi:MAG: hypothetical protein ABW185_27480, partial [Sedimenticola sp.]